MNWWQAHWPKVAALGFLALVLLTVIIAVIAGSSSNTGTVLPPPPPPPIPPATPTRMPPPVVIGYDFSFPAGTSESAVRAQLTSFLGLVPPSSIISANRNPSNALDPNLWTTSLQTPNIQRGPLPPFRLMFAFSAGQLMCFEFYFAAEPAAADIFNRLCSADTPGATAVPECGISDGAGRRRTQTTPDFVFISTSFVRSHCMARIVKHYDLYLNV